MPAFSLQRMHVLLSQNQDRAIVVERMALAGPDEELSQIGEELQKPVIIATARFGDVVLDRYSESFEGKGKWNDNIIDVSFPVGDSGSIEEALAAAESLWADQRAWKQRVEEFAVKELLSLKNDVWLRDGEPPLTATEFTKRMSLQSISVSTDGNLEFWYDDGDLFWDHAIAIRGNVQDGLTRAVIEG
jgi:hypothetical protein